MRYSQRLALKNETPYSVSSRTQMRATNAGEYWRSEKRICSVVKYRTERISAAASSRTGPSCFDLALRGVVSQLYGSRLVRDLSAVLQSVRSARPRATTLQHVVSGKAGDGDRMPAGERNSSSGPAASQRPSCRSEALDHTRQSAFRPSLRSEILRCRSPASSGPSLWSK
jgi:hypothetical protein